MRLTGNPIFPMLLKVTRTFLFVLFLVTAGIIANAQPDADIPPENPIDPQDTPVPFTGIEWLLLGGAAIGGSFKMLKRK